MIAWRLVFSLPSAVSRSVHTSNFTLDTGRSQVLCNTPAIGRVVGQMLKNRHISPSEQRKRVCLSSVNVCDVVANYCERVTDIKCLVLEIYQAIDPMISQIY